MQIIGFDYLHLWAQYPNFFGIGFVCFTRSGLCGISFNVTTKMRPTTNTTPPADLTESCSVYQQCIFVFPNTESVNVTGPSSLSPGLTCCQATFLQQLPFLTSAALTWLHLTVVRNLFRFSMMKYYTETPGRALLYVLFVIPQLSLCYGWLWLLFYSGVKQHKST